MDGHTAVFNHVKIEVPRRGLFGKGQMQEVRSVHLHCDKTKRYFVIYATSTRPTRHSDRTMQEIVDSLQCHGFNRAPRLSASIMHTDLQRGRSAKIEITNGLSENRPVMMKENVKDLAVLASREAERLGADYAEARIQGGVGYGFHAEERRTAAVDDGGQLRDGHQGDLRGALAFGATNIMEKAAVRSLAARP